MKTEKCRICSSKNIYPVRMIVSPHGNNPYNLIQCRDCLCRTFDQHEHAVDIQDFYEKLAGEHQTVKNPTFKENKSWRILRDKIITQLGINPQSILDVGCRTGDFLMHFDKNIIREGVEISSEYATIASSRGLTIYNDFLENTQFQRKYDIVSCLAILEHLVDPVIFLNKLNQLVSPGGILLILIPTYECFKETLLHKLDRQWHMYRPPEHLNFYSQYFLDQFMVDKGFAIVKREFTSGGMFNPFSNYKSLKKIFATFMFYYDLSPLNRFPVFDHLYCYYVNITSGRQD
ncbi:MAG: class I SAM-dependent methyltransferase [Calditrichales bacterium]|nr:MAG: class I SAM-dependent methyltransferase [Calditrichales bacterium]